MLPRTLCILFIATVLCCRASEKTRLTYDQHCAACHETGAGGAPARQAKMDWEIRRNQKPQELLASVRRGFVGMPPSGRCLNCSDGELLEVIKYMRD